MSSQLLQYFTAIFHNVFNNLQSRDSSSKLELNIIRIRNINSLNGFPTFKISLHNLKLPARSRSKLHEKEINGLLADMGNQISLKIILNIE